MVYAQTSICPRIKRVIFWGFELQTDYLIFARKPDLVLINKKKRTCHQVDFQQTTL